MTTEQELEDKKAEFEKLSRQIANIEAGPVRVQMKRMRNTLTGEMVVLRQKLVQAEVEIALAGGTPKAIPTLSFGK